MNDGIYTNTQNITNDPATISLCPMITINFPYLSHHIGLTPVTLPVFSLPHGRYHRPFSFDPDIIYDSSYTLKVEMVSPVQFYPGFYSSNIYPINAYPIGPNNVTMLDSATGALTWLTPWWTGGFMVSYRMSLYDRDTFVCSTTRDFMIDVLDSDYVFAGIDPIPAIAPPLNCYPNPSNGNFTIDMTGFGVGYKTIAIYDYLGSLMYSRESGDEIVSLSAKNLSSGIYIVKVNGMGQMATHKIIITNN